MMRWLAVGATLIAGLLGILIHWHVSIGSTNVYNGVRKATLIAGHVPMTSERCGNLAVGTSEDEMYVTYGGDQSDSFASDPAETWTGHDKGNDEWFYNIDDSDPRGSDACLVFFNNHKRINEVAQWVQLTP